MDSKCNLCLVSRILLIVGGLNLGLIGAFEYDLIGGVLGTWPIVVRIVYVLIGLAGVYCLVGLAKGGKSGSCASHPSGGASSGGL